MIYLNKMKQVVLPSSSCCRVSDFDHLLILQYFVLFFCCTNIFPSLW